MLIKTKNLDKNKEIVAEIKDRISDLKQRIKEMSETEKKKMLMRHYRLSKKFLITVKMFKKFSSLHQNLIKENQGQSLEKGLQIG